MADMVTKSDTATAYRAHGKALKDLNLRDGFTRVEQIDYGFEWQEFPDTDSMVAAGAQLSLKQQLKVVNDVAKTTARQAANSKAVDEAGFIKPNAENDSQVRLKTVFTGIYGKLLSKGMEKDAARLEARKRAAELLEEQWADDSDEG